jgi:hypothetical protein
MLPTGGGASVTDSAERRCSEPWERPASAYRCPTLNAHAFMVLQGKVTLETALDVIDCFRRGGKVRG